MKNNIDYFLRLITKNFDIKKILEEKKGEKEVKRYYLTNHLAYLLFHNRNGFMHMGLSRNNCFKKDDLIEPLKIINSYITKVKAKTVLELGSGNGANSAYLAKNNPQIQFLAIDLSKKPLTRFKKLSNFKQEFGDYHDLKRYKDKSVDIAFAIETLCHSRNKKIVLNEVRKKLKRNGLLIIFDGYLSKDFEKMSKEEKTSATLTSKAIAIDSFEPVERFEKTTGEAGLKITEKENLSSLVLPTMEKLQNLALKFYLFQPLTKFLIAVLPYDLTKNSIAGLLMPVLVKRKIGCYYLYVLKKY